MFFTTKSTKLNLKEIADNGNSYTFGVLVSGQNVIWIIKHNTKHVFIQMICNLIIKVIQSTDLHSYKNNEPNTYLYLYILYFQYLNLRNDDFRKWMKKYCRPRKKVNFPKYLMRMIRVTRVPQLYNLERITPFIETTKASQNNYLVNCNVLSWTKTKSRANKSRQTARFRHRSSRT